ncbi:MAG TPA: class I SAM-dependent methyltransferase, partial [Oscillibacter sp.]|nr:class I SAM-dependent methyltransferase [Oscillibacter sp.]
MRKRKDFWDRNAGLYDRFMRKDGAAYEMMYEMIQPVVRHKTVLELATGTGLIAKHIVNAAAHIEATDASAEMIAEAKRDNRSAKLHFSVQDMFR